MGFKDDNCFSDAENLMVWNLVRALDPIVGSTGPRSGERDYRVCGSRGGSLQII